MKGRPLCTISLLLAQHGRNQRRHLCRQPRHETLVIDKASIGGTIGKVSTVTHCSALIQDETGETFANRMKAEALASGVEIIYETVIPKQCFKVILKNSIQKYPKTMQIESKAHVYLTKTVIIADGCTPRRRLNITGENRLWGKGIGMNAAKSAKDYAGKNVYVVGGADGAVKEALYLSNFAQSVTIIHFEDTLGCIPEFLNKVKAASKHPCIDLLPLSGSLRRTPC